MSSRKSISKQLVSVIMCLILIIGILPLGAVPVQAATVSGIFAAAHVGADSAAQTTLPAQVDVNGQMKDVTWFVYEGLFDKPYAAVQAIGVTADNDTVYATVEVVPESIVFFADVAATQAINSTMDYDSPSYAAIAALAAQNGGALLNDKADQVYDGTNGWGHSALRSNGTTVDLQYKSKESGTHNKTTTTGLFTQNAIGAKNTYTIQLPAGEYSLTMGLYDWWSNASRRSDIFVTVPGGERTQLGSISYNAEPTYKITVPEAGTVLVEIVATNANQSPMLNWVAVAEGDVEGGSGAAAHLIVVNGDDVKADNVNGLTYKGIGVLSANSTSDLLMDYKSQHPEAYAELLDVLFGGDYPIMTHVKMEMGNDRNNSTGPEAATMRAEDEAANVLRNPGWQLAADAKKLNPDVKVSILNWNAPVWAGRDADKVYKWYKDTILAAYREYGYMVDYVNPNVNEHWESAYVQATINYANRVKNDTEGFESAEEQALFNAIKIVVSDEVGTGSFGGTLFSNQEFHDAVDVAGFHYSPNDDSAGNFKRFADESDKEVWNSEAQATFSNSAFRPNNNVADPTVPGTGIGGTGSALEMANTLIKGFVNSRRTHVIYQPAIGAFYEGGQYSYKELVSARDPWSGWIHYDAGLAVLRHFTQFAVMGWENEDNTAGIWRAVPEASAAGATGTNPVVGRNGLPNYMTMAAPDKSDFSTVIVNDSEYELTYKVMALNMQLDNSQAMELWETRAADDGAFNENYKQYLGDIAKGADGMYTVTVKPYSIVTLTTLDCSDSEEHNTPLPVEGERTVLDTNATGDTQDTTDNYLYADDFDYTGKQVAVIAEGGGLSGEYEDYVAARGGDTGAMARYIQETNGAFETYLRADGNRVLRQQLDSAAYGVGSAWNGGDAVALLGDFRWTNYRVATDILFENTNSTPYAAVGIRQNAGSQQLAGSSYALKVWYDGGWELQRLGTRVAGGNVVSGSGTQVDFATGADVWNHIALQGAGDTITAYINGVQVATYVDSVPQFGGRASLGASYNFIQFDNLEITKVEGYEPYYAELLDNMEFHDLAPEKNTRLVYNSLWSHANGQGMYEYQRSFSTSRGAGATVAYTFTGTGLDVLGSNGGTARLKATVDGQVIANNAPTQAAGNVRLAYSLRGLPYGQHTVELELLSGTLVIDAIAVAGGNATGAVDVALLEETYAATQDFAQRPEFDATQWAIFAANRETTAQVLADDALCGLDQQGIDQLEARLLTAYESLTGGAVVAVTNVWVATYEGTAPALPAQVEAELEDGETILVDVVWEEVSPAAFTAYDTVSVQGTARRKAVTCFVEVVPANTLYFADVGAVAGLGLTYDSPAYLAVAALAQAGGAPLLNDKPDQVYTDGAAYGHSATGSVSYKGVVAGNYSKYSTTGLYTSNSIGAKTQYTVTLPAGTYQLAAGAYDWWPGYGRSAYARVTDSAGVVTDIATIRYDDDPDIFTGEFTVTQDGLVVFELEAFSANQSPMMNFVIISEVVQASKEDLQALYDQVKNLKEAYYTADSWATFAPALAAAAEVLADEDATAAEILAAYNGLYTAFQDLATRGDVGVLSIFYDSFAKLVESDSTAASWAPFKAAMEAAKALIDAPQNAAQTAVEAALTELITTRNNLKDAVSTGPLAEAIRYAEALLEDKDQYIEASVTKLEAALEKAKAVLELPEEERTAQVVTQATMDLLDVVRVMFEKGDLRALAALVASAKRVDETKFTPASWAAVATALAEAEALLVDPDALQDEADAAYSKLSNAIRALVAAANPSGLETAMSVAKSILDNASQYVPASIEGLQALYDQAALVLADKNAAQTAVDEMAQQLLAKAMQARKPANKSLLKASLGRAGSVSGQFSQASTDALAAAMAEAEKLARDGNATQEQIDAAQAAVEAALAGLETKAPEAGVEQAVVQDPVQQSPAVDDTAVPVPAGGDEVKARTKAEVTEPAAVPAENTPAAQEARPVPEQAEALPGEAPAVVPAPAAQDGGSGWAGITIAALALMAAAGYALLRRRNARKD